MSKRTRLPRLFSPQTIFVLLGLVLAVAAAMSARTPRPSDVIRRAMGSDRVLVAADGQVIQTLRTDFNKRRLVWNPLTNFPENVRTTIVESEDRRFFSHFGLDVLGLARASWAILRGRSVQGASTITMQVTDLIQDDVLFRNAKIQKGSLPHKFVQIARAVFLEMKWSKDEILEAYLNLIHLKGEYQGVPAVARAYLNKDPLALDLGEAVTIAAMISSPNQGLKALTARACQLAARMGHQDCEWLKGSVASFFARTPSLPTNFGQAPHLARRLFQANPGEAIVSSTIDARLQNDVISILEKNIARLREQNVNDTAAIVIDNATGAVVAYVGAVSTSKSPHVDGVQSYRQAGSSLKPFLYAKAIEMKRLTAASILLDEPTAISWGKDVYRPTNYDKHFYGTVSVREALASSLNVPAVKTVTIIGLNQSYQVLQSIHLTGLKHPDFYGVSLALGAVDVRLDELANAYRIFANKGDWSPIRFTTDEKAVKTDSVYSAETSYILSSILSDPNARSIGFGWESPLETPFFAAVKTGTSKDYRDNWCVGYSSRYTVGVWAGNFDAQAMDKVSGVSGSGPSWYEIMLKLHERERSVPPVRPAGIVEKLVRHKWVSHERDEVFIKGTEPESSVIEPSMDKQAQFVFPAEGSVLIKDPHQDQERIALFVRFKGTIPPNSRLHLDGRDLGEAVSPFKVTDLPSGIHEMWIGPSAKEALTKVRFTVKGAR